MDMIVNCVNDVKFTVNYSENNFVVRDVISGSVLRWRHLARGEGLSTSSTRANVVTMSRRMLRQSRYI